MKKTINQLVKEFNRFADSHKIIKSFNAKPITQLMAKNLQYPIMWMSFEGAEFDAGEIVVNSNVYFLDRLAKDNSNLIQLLSDNLQLANDFYTLYNDNELKYDFFFDNVANAEPIVFEYDDVLCGWMMPIRISITNDRNEANVPID